ncbi:ABC transporter permease [Kitasatospora sp. NPDC089509]|uniref:ABC transporter permease n=1 Tax=Kitasatospora sp. NPDC089509 TaxID=3364079 RepID=UPI003820EF62
MSTDALTDPARQAPATAAPAAPAARERSATPRLRGLLWLSLRQNCLLLWLLVALTVLTAANLLWIHVASQHIVGVLRRTGCYTSNSDACWTVLAPINEPYFWFGSVLQPAVTAVPLLIGVFIGAPLLAQEHERGTIRLIRAQSVSPVRWLAARLAVPGLAVLALTGVLASLMTWVWWNDLIKGPASFDPPFQFFTYPALGLAPIVWSLFALALGVLVGQVVRRTLPAMFLTAALVAITHGLMRWARPSFHSTVDAVVPLGALQPNNAWLVDVKTVFPDGRRISTESCFDPHSCDGAVNTWLSYHPAGHLVPIQLVESGILLALTAAALLAVFRLIRR